jgi:hypothetical protein
MTSALRELTNAMEQQERLLEKISVEAEQCRLEAEKYRDIANLDKKGQEAFLWALGREARGGKMRSFFLGVASSALVTALGLVASALLKLPPTHP